MLSRTTAALAALLFVVNASAAAEPSTQPEQAPLRGVCRFGMKDGQLTLSVDGSQLANREVRVFQGPHGSGPWQVLAVRDPQGRIVQLQMHATRRLATGEVQRDSVFIHAWRIMTISRNTVDGKGSARSVFLSVQGRPPAPGADGFVASQVVEQATEVAGNQARLVGRVVEPDLASLLRLRSALKPQTVSLLRDVGLSVLEPADPAEAFQVLSDHRPVDEAAAADVRSLLPALASDRFDEREAASARLRALGRPGAIAIRRMDRKGLTPEQSARLDAAASVFFPLTNEQAAARRSDPDFLTGCLLSDDRTDRAEAVARLERWATPTSPSTWTPRRRTAPPRPR